jgi:hypothetical protein
MIAIECAALHGEAVVDLILYAANAAIVGRSGIDAMRPGPMTPIARNCPALTWFCTAATAPTPISTWSPMTSTALPAPTGIDS